MKKKLVNDGFVHRLLYLHQSWGVREIKGEKSVSTVEEMNWR